MLKKLLVWLIRNAIMLLIVTLIFSSVTASFPNLLKGVFGDIFDYASQEAQKRVVSELTENCSSLDKSKDVVSIVELCTNSTMLDSMKKNCIRYYELKKNGIKVENEEQFKESCQSIESGEIDRECEKIKSLPRLPDFASIGSLCKDYQSGKINDKEFFFGVVIIPFSGIDSGIPRVGFLEWYNKVTSYLNSNKLLYIMILMALVLLLYIVVRDNYLFFREIGSISFGTGIIILLPYLAIIIYDRYVGIDTTSILGGMLGLGNILNLKALASVIFLLFLRTYNNFIIVMGIACLVAGIAAKVYGAILKTKAMKPEAKSDKQEVSEELPEESDVPDLPKKKKRKRT